jgi:phage terminase Nu1 subunit (DNA packaging protein)
VIASTQNAEPGKSKRHERLTAGETAIRLCISARQLQNLVDLGLPKVGHGKGCYFAWQDVFPWFVNYKIELNRPKGVKEDATNLTAAQLRKVNAEAALAELKLARERGEVISVQDVEKAVAEVSANVRARLLGMPAKLAGLLVGLTKPKVKAAIEQEVNQALAELTKTAADTEGED